jgi:hypothetical protein
MGRSAISTRAMKPERAVQASAARCGETAPAQPPKRYFISFIRFAASGFGSGGKKDFLIDADFNILRPKFYTYPLILVQPELSWRKRIKA